METSNGLSNSQHRGIEFLFPPQTALEAECFSHSIGEVEGSNSPKWGLRRHQRTYSDSMLSEEVPCWLKELLDEHEPEPEPEPEMPPSRSHRRSSSDSIAYLQTSERKSKLSNTCSVTFPQEANASQTEMIEKQNVADPEGSLVQNRSLYSNPSASRTDSKRAKRYVLSSTLSTLWNLCLQ
ncbi:hypothetical protein VNO77_25768 [Canavalia gladiata]|uniref:Uncharacterized protein n=1 Tax=Canavalia gladiata TaxID=3824 RepID=A0AAN9KUV2_CANGL